MRTWLRPELVARLADLSSDRVVQVRGCRICGGNHVHYLVDLLANGLWRTIGRVHNDSANTLDFAPAVRERRLYLMPPGTRLEDHAAEDAAADGTAWLDRHAKLNGAKDSGPGVCKVGR